MSHTISIDIPKVTRETYDEQHVQAVVVYGKTADHKLYEDAAYTTEAVQDEVVSLFQKNLLLINDGSNILKPVAMTAAKAIVTVTADESAVSSATWTAKAAE